MRRRDEEGTALVEVTWLAVLLLVPLVYVVLAVYDVQRASFAATTAARSAGRAFVLAPDVVSGQARARAAVQVAVRDQGLETATTSLSCQPSCLTPGSVVDVRVSSQVRLPFLPAVLGDQAPSIRVSAAQRVPYGSFRQDRS